MLPCTWYHMRCHNKKAFICIKVQAYTTPPSSSGRSPECVQIRPYPLSTNLHPLCTTSRMRGAATTIMSGNKTDSPSNTLSTKRVVRRRPRIVQPQPLFLYAPIPVLIKWAVVLPCTWYHMRCHNKKAFICIKVQAYTTPPSSSGRSPECVQIRPYPLSTNLHPLCTTSRMRGAATTIMSGNKTDSTIGYICSCPSPNPA